MHSTESSFENFEIIEQIGHGGMSIVYRARDRILDREVAIKVMNPIVGEKTSARERFFNEARICIQLDHPNIVRIISLGLAKDERPFIVMELLRGKSFDKFLEEKGKLTKEDFEMIFPPVLDGLVYAHENNLVHRDLKPANIFICEPSTTADSGRLHNQIKILDFGIAKRLSPGHLERSPAPSSPSYLPDSSTPDSAKVGNSPCSENPRSTEERQPMGAPGIAAFQAAPLDRTSPECSTKQGQQLTFGILGSPLYMSPEQCAGKAADCRSDIYSLGCIMYHALAGEPPFLSDSAFQAMYRRLNESVPTLSKQVSKAGYSLKLIELIITALSRDPAGRPASAAQFRDALRAALDEKHSLKHSNKTSVLVGFVLLVLSLFSLLYWTSATGLKESKNVLRKSPSIAEQEKEALKSTTERKLEVRGPEFFRARGRLKEAAAMYQELLKKAEANPDKDEGLKSRYEAHLALAEIFCQMEDYKNGYAEYEKAIAVYPLASSAKRLTTTGDYARNLMSHGKKEKSLNLMRKATQEALNAERETEIPNKSLPASFHALGDLELSCKNKARAIAAYEKAIELYEKSMDQLCSSAAVYAAFNLYDLYDKKNRQGKGTKLLESVKNDLLTIPNHRPDGMRAFALSASKYKEMNELAVQYFNLAIENVNEEPDPIRRREILEECKAALKNMKAGK